MYFYSAYLYPEILHVREAENTDHLAYRPAGLAGRSRTESGLQSPSNSWITTPHTSGRSDCIATDSRVAPNPDTP